MPLTESVLRVPFFHLFDKTGGVVVSDKVLRGSSSQLPRPPLVPMSGRNDLRSLKTVKCLRRIRSVISTNGRYRWSSLFRSRSLCRLAMYRRADAHRSPGLRRTSKGRIRLRLRLAVKRFQYLNRPEVRIEFRLMTNYRLTLEAKADLIQIWNYSDGLWGSPQADRYIEGLEVCNEFRVGDTGNIPVHAEQGRKSAIPAAE